MSKATSDQSWAETNKVLTDTGYYPKVVKRDDTPCTGNKGNHRAYFVAQASDYQEYADD